MAEPRRGRSAPDARTRRRSPAATLVSLALHGALVVVIAQALEIHAPFVAFFQHDDAQPTPERVTYVTTPPSRTLAPASEGGGDGRARRPAASTPAPRLVAPPAVPEPVPASPAPPVAVPTPAPSPARAADGRGTGQGTGFGELTGPAAGLRPTYTGPIVWQRPESPHAHPISVAEKIDSLIATDFVAVRDSMAAVAGMRQPGDWTFERNGRTYGIDQRYIHLGSFSIPTAILGALPIRQQANPTQIERERRIGGMMRESRAQGLRRAGDMDFDDVVKSIRERKDRERNERRANRAARSGSAGATPPPSR